MPLDGATTTIAVTASEIVVRLVNDNRGIFITFVLLGLLAVILGRLGRLLVIVVPAPLVVPVSIISWLRMGLVFEI